MGGLSDEMLSARFLDSPYVQFFCGEAVYPSLFLQVAGTGRQRCTR
jgi:hypothetical protein